MTKQTDDDIVHLDYRSRQVPEHPHSNVTDLFLEVCRRKGLDDPEIFRVMADAFEVVAGRNIGSGPFEIDDTRQDAYSDGWVVLGRIIEEHEPVEDLLTDKQRDRAEEIITSRPAFK